MKVDFSVVEQALISGTITIDQFCRIQVDAFGKRKARQIIRRNLGIKAGSPEDVVIKRLTA